MGAIGSPAFQAHSSEIFDTSGMPRRPTTFLEQQIFKSIASHPKGDLRDAARIQGKIGKYYADKGDEERARAAFLLASAAEETTESPERLRPAPEAPPSSKEPPSRPVASGFSGNYYGYEGRTLHTWEFADDGALLHTWIVSGAGTSVRNSERASFVVKGDTLELRVKSAAGGFVTPGVGGRSAISGGGAEAVSELRRMRLQILKAENAIVLDGVRLKRRSW